MSFGINDIRREIGQGPSDGDGVVATPQHQFAVGGIDGHLRGSVGVDEPATEGGHDKKPLAAQAEIVEWQVVALCHQHAPLGGHATARDAVIDKIAIETVGVAPVGLGHDIELSACGEHGEDIFDRCVEGHRGMAGDAAVRREVPLADDEVYEMCQRPLRHHHALGLARGAGGIDDVSYFWGVWESGSLGVWTMVILWGVWESGSLGVWTIVIIWGVWESGSLGVWTMVILIRRVISCPLHPAPCP